MRLHTRLLSLLLLSAAPIFASADSPQAKPDHIYLTSGEIVIGVITDQIPGESVTVTLPDGSLRVINIAEIKRTDRERDTGAASHRLNKGYKGIYSFSFTKGGAKDLASNIRKPSSDNIELAVVQGYQVNHWLYAGAGVAWQFYYGGYRGNERSFSNFPIFANVRISPLRNYITPFLDLRGGGYVGKLHGAYFRPSLGVRFGITRKCGFSFAIGYTVQTISGDLWLDRDFKSFDRYFHLKTNLSGLTIAATVDL